MQQYEKRLFIPSTICDFGERHYTITFVHLQLCFWFIKYLFHAEIKRYTVYRSYFHSDIGVTAVITKNENSLARSSLRLVQLNIKAFLTFAPVYLLDKGTCM